MGAGRMGGDTGAANPFGMGGLGGLGEWVGWAGWAVLGRLGRLRHPQSADSRPPEERFQVQLEVRKRSAAVVVTGGA